MSGHPGGGWDAAPRGGARVTYLGGHGVARGPELQTDRQRGPEGGGRHRCGRVGQPLAPLSVRSRSAASAPPTESESRCAARDRPEGRDRARTHLLAFLLHPPPAGRPAPQPGLSPEFARLGAGFGPPAPATPRPPRPCNLLLTSPPIRIKLPRGGAGNPHGRQAPTRLMVAPRLCLPTCPRPPTPPTRVRLSTLVEEWGTIWGKYRTKLTRAQLGAS